jgi:shikimate dehydrogenase
MQKRPTMYFFGVTTGASSSRVMFPLWAEILALGDAQLVGVDLPINAPAGQYRRAVGQIKEDPLSLGALVTTHKINVLRAAGDLFETLTPEATLCEEVSCIYKRDGALIGHAVDPETSGAAMRRFIGRDYWERHGADVLCLGAGGSAVALVTYFSTRASPGQRPRRMVIVNRSQGKLDNMRALLNRLPPSGISFDLVRNSDPAVNDQIMAGLPDHSMVINATGMGKDIPGSPITDKALFPQGGIAWELNYRGDLQFLRQAQAQKEGRGLWIEDGWGYFLLGWSEVIGTVFDIRIDAEVFKRLAAAAASIRG